MVFIVKLELELEAVSESEAKLKLECIKAGIQDNASVLGGIYVDFWEEK